MSIFDKCDAFTFAREVRAMGIYPYFTPIQETTATEARIDGEWKIMVGSNNYLGLTHHPKVLEAARARGASLRRRLDGQPVSQRNARSALRARGTTREVLQARSGARLHDGLSGEPRRARDRCSAATITSFSTDSTTHRSSTARGSASARCIAIAHGDFDGLVAAACASAERRGQARRHRRRVLDGRHHRRSAAARRRHQASTAPPFSSTKRTRSASRRRWRGHREPFWIATIRSI